MTTKFVNDNSVIIYKRCNYFDAIGNTGFKNKKVYKYRVMDGVGTLI